MKRNSQKTEVRCGKHAADHFSGSRGLGRAGGRYQDTCHLYEVETGKLPAQNSRYCVLPRKCVYSMQIENAEGSGSGVNLLAQKV